MINYKVSENFVVMEFRCKCCNLVNVGAGFWMLVEHLQALREHLGKPCIIHSGYRCPKHNAAVGGVDESAHSRGEGVDVHFKDVSHIEVARAAAAQPEFFSLGGIGLSGGWVHLDVMRWGTPRRWGWK